MVASSVLPGVRSMVLELLVFLRVSHRVSPLFGNSSTTTAQVYPVVEATHVLSSLAGDIGGQMGLFIGASILTILELFDYIYEVRPPPFTSSVWRAVGLPALMPHWDGCRPGLSTPNEPTWIINFN